jgi:hypothetical protein
MGRRIIARDKHKFTKVASDPSSLGKTLCQDRSENVLGYSVTVHEKNKDIEDVTCGKAGTCACFLSYVHRQRK